MSLLSFSDVTVRYGSVVALDAVTLAVEEKGITSLVGPNGAGKSTLLGVASGFIATDAGQVRWADRLQGGGPHAFARAGIRRTFQTPRVMAGASLLENVLVGTHTNVRSWFLADLLDTTARYRREALQMAQASQALSEVGLGDRADEPAGSLSYGQARLLELARAMAGQPRLLLLDEPAAGLNDEETAQLGVLLQNLAVSASIGVVLVEHNLALVTSISDVVHVLNFGQLIASGSPQAVINEPAVIEAYTGRTE